MRKKKSKMIWIVLILVLILIGMLCFYFTQNNSVKASSDSNTTTTSITEVTVSTQTIEKTLSSSGEISSSLTENLELNTYRYFSQMCVEKNQAVKEGENILAYTNGTYLTAPYDCVIIDYSVPEVSSICTSKNYIQVQSTKDLYMTLTIDETEIKKVAVGQEVIITVNAFEDKTYTGSITKINEIGSYASNGSNFTATVSFANDGDVKIGMSASCSVTLEKVEDVIAVPVEAIQTKNNQKYVIAVSSNGTTKECIVETGLSNDAYVEIKSGLNGNETIQMTKTTSTTGNTRGSGMMEQMQGGPMGENGGYSGKGQTSKGSMPSGMNP